jgi:choline dehydrogenase
MSRDEIYDYVIVGAGAAGCVLAARLTEDRDVRVLLLEAGGGDRNPVFGIPIMAGILLRNRYANWLYTTEPEPHLNDRVLTWPRGKVVGGSSSINGMVYTRGLDLDFDGWAQMGLRSWSADRVRPYFTRSQSYAGGADHRHGDGGPLPIARPEPWSPVSEAFVQAGAQAGFPLTADFNGDSPEGFGRYDFNIHRGRRVSAARAFLDPARARPGLTVVTRAQAMRVMIEGRRAIGVEVDVRGHVRSFRAEREVLLCGGTVNSPQLLQLSGIGDPELLSRHGIPIVAPLSGVGENLQDHCLIRVSHACTQPVTLHQLMRFDRAALALVQALVFGSGPMTRFPLETGAFIRSDPALDAPDVQCHFLPGLTTAALRLPGLRNPHLAHDGDGFFANAYPMRPESRGSIRIRSADPLAPPSIRPNFLSAAKDRLVLRRSVKILRDVFTQRAFDPFRGRELTPGPQVKSDAEIDAFIRATADSVFHPVGTCKMGLHDDAVVDEALRVRGVEGLRVVDASVMPAIASNNTHAPTIMIAERASDMIRGISQ